MKRMFSFFLALALLAVLSGCGKQEPTPSKPDEPTPPPEEGITLAELNVDGIEPTAHAAPRTNVLRDDVAGIDFSRETMLSNAPEVIDGELIRMPQVLPGEGMS